MNLPFLHRRKLRMALSALLMVSGVVVTLATSQDVGGGFRHLASLEPMNVTVWETTVVMGEEEAAVHLFFSVPTNLLEAYEDQITLSVEVEVDKTEITTSPTTAWEVLVGDATSPVVSSTTTGSGEVHEFGTWEFVWSFESDPIPVLQDCAGDDCIPCDLSGDRCEVIFTLRRDAETFPAMRVDVRADMLQTDFGDPEPASARPAGF